MLGLKLLIPFPSKFIRGVVLLGVFFFCFAGSVLAAFLYFLLSAFCGLLIARVQGLGCFSGCYFWVFGWASYVCSEALYAFLVYLECISLFCYIQHYLKKKKSFVLL